MEVGGLGVYGVVEWELMIEYWNGESMLRGLRMVYIFICSSIYKQNDVGKKATLLECQHETQAIHEGFGIFSRGAESESFYHTDLVN